MFGFAQCMPNPGVSLGFRHWFILQMSSWSLCFASLGLCDTWAAWSWDLSQFTHRVRGSSFPALSSLRFPYTFQPPEFPFPGLSVQKDGLFSDFSSTETQLRLPLGAKQQKNREREIVIGTSLYPWIKGAPFSLVLWSERILWDFRSPNPHHQSQADPQVGLPWGRVRKEKREKKKKETNEMEILLCSPAKAFPKALVRNKGVSPGNFAANTCYIVPQFHQSLGQSPETEEWKQTPQNSLWVWAMLYLTPFTSCLLLLTFQVPQAVVFCTVQRF